MKKKAIYYVIYYAIILAFILCGFLVGSKEYMSEGGYKYNTGKTEEISGYTFYVTDEVGNYSKVKEIGWYFLPFKISTKYLLIIGDAEDGIITELSKEYIRENTPYSVHIDGERFEKIFNELIIAFVVICLILIILPFCVLFLKKISKEKKKKIILKKIKELTEMKEQGIISEEEYNTKKQVLIEKTK